MEEVGKIGRGDCIVGVCSERFDGRVILVLDLMRGLGIEFDECMGRIVEGKKGVVEVVGSEEVVGVDNVVIMVGDSERDVVEFRVEVERVDSVRYDGWGVGVGEMRIGSCVGSEVGVCWVECDRWDKWKSRMFV